MTCKPTACSPSSRDSARCSTLASLQCACNRPKRARIGCRRTRASSQRAMFRLCTLPSLPLTTCSMESSTLQCAAFSVRLCAEQFYLAAQLSDQQLQAVERLASNSSAPAAAGLSSTTLALTASCPLFLFTAWSAIGTIVLHPSCVRYRHDSIVMELSVYCRERTPSRRLCLRRCLC